MSDTTPIPPASERERFEAWFEADSFPSESDWFRREIDDPDEYFYGVTHGAWKAWQARAALSHPSTPQGWKLAPVEPDSAMLDRAVAFALNVFLSSEYRWTDYMKDLWATMLAGSPPPPEQGGKG